METEKNNTLPIREKQFRGQWISYHGTRRKDSFQVLEKKKKELLEFIIWYLAKMHFRNDGEIKVFSDEGKLRESVGSRSTIKE